MAGMGMLAGAYSAFNATGSDSGTVTAGNLEIRLGLSAGDSEELDFGGIGCLTDNMAPGDVCTATIRVRNDGSLPLTYTVEALVVPPGCFIVTWVGPTDTNVAGGTTPGAMPPGAELDKESLDVYVEVVDDDDCQAASAAVGVKVIASS